MGQKTNSNILRLGFKQKEWNSKYFEQNKEEFTLYSYQNIQIQNYLTKFLYINGLFLRNCKLYFNDTNLHISISYFATKNINFFIKKKMFNYRIKLINKTNTRKKYKKTETNLKINYFLKNSKKELINKIKRIYVLKRYKNSLYQKNYVTYENLTKNNLIEQILESLSLFTNKKFNIFLALQHVNRGISINIHKEEQKYIKKQIIFLKRYSKSIFFKESINIAYLTTRTKNSALILTEFIAKQLAILKRHNQFLIFLKKLLILFVNSKFSKTKGIKIIINGRFNSAPRAKNRSIIAGCVPIQTLSKQIQYYQSTGYNKNGTFGVKLWIN